MSFVSIILHSRESTINKGLSLHYERHECRLCRINGVFRVEQKVEFLYILMNIYYHKYYILYYYIVNI